MEKPRCGPLQSAPGATISGLIVERRPDTGASRASHPLYHGIATLLFADPEVLQYVETHGAKSVVIEYGLTRSPQGIGITSAGGGSSEEMQWVPGTGCVAWRQTEVATNTDLQGDRVGNTIHFSGTLGGKSVRGCED